MKKKAVIHLLHNFQIVKLAKKLKKEKVNVDVINFGEEVGSLTRPGFFNISLF